jgi:hypothetical protein
MDDDWKTPRQPRLVGHLNDASGHSVAFSVDRDAVIIRRGGEDMRLGPDERDLFSRRYFEAEAAAEEWAKEHAGAGDG